MKVTNLKEPTDVKIRKVIRKTKSLTTTPPGTKILSAGQGIGFRGTDGTLRIIDRPWIENTNLTLDSAAATIQQARENLEETRTLIDTTSERINAAELTLKALDTAAQEQQTLLNATKTELDTTAADLTATRDEMRSWSTTIAGDLGTLGTRLSTAERDLTAARSNVDGLAQRMSASEDTATTVGARLDTVSSNLDATALRLNGVFGDINRLGADIVATTSLAEGAEAKAAAAGESLAAAASRLTIAEDSLTGLGDRVGDVETSAASALSQAGAASTAATEAARTAGQAAKDLEALENQLTAALAQSEGMYPDSSYEDETRSTATVPVIEVGDRAASGSKVAEFRRSRSTSGNIFAYWEYVPVVGGRVYRVEMRARAEAGAPLIDAWIGAKRADGSTFANNQAIRLAPVSEDWTRLYADWTAPEGAVEARFFPLMQPSNPSDAVAWVDDFQVVDTTEQATLRLQVEAAKNAAESAAATAQAAATAADQAQKTADGKGTQVWSLTAPSGVGLSTSDVHHRVSSLAAGGTTLQSWRWNGKAWIESKLSDELFNSITVGKLTGVFADIGKHLQAGSIGADKVLVGWGGNIFPDPSLTNQRFVEASFTAARYGAIGTGEDGGGSVLIEAGTVRRGGYFGASAATPHHRIPVTPGSQYLVKASVRPSHDVPNAGVLMYFRVYNSATGAWAFTTPTSATLPSMRALQWHKLSATVTIPAGYDQLVIGYYAQATYTGSARFSSPSVQQATNGELIVNGSITGTHVDAQSVGAAVGEFVKVRAENVEVTKELAARLVTAMDVATRNLIVTGDATLSGKTWIEDLAAVQIAAAKISAQQIEVTETFSAEVARLMSAEVRNLIVTGDAKLTGETWITNLAGEAAKLAKIDVGNLTVTGTSTMDTAVANRMFADIFTSNKITTREMLIGSASNLIVGGWADQSEGWAGFTRVTDTAVTAGQPSTAVWGVDGRRTLTATQRIPVTPGEQYRFSVYARSDTANSRFYVQLMTGAQTNPYVVVNQSPPTNGWAEYTSEWTAPEGTREISGIRVYGGHQNGAVPGWQWFGSMTFASALGAVNIGDGAITTPKLKVTEEMAAAIVKAMAVDTKSLVVTEKAVMQHAEVLGKSIVNDINVRGKLVGRDGTFTGTVEAENIIVTKEFSAEIVRAMDAELQKLVVTEEALLANATVIGAMVVNELKARAITTERIAGVEGQLEKLLVGDLTLTGHFRSGPEGEPGVVIPQNYVTDRNFEQLGVWLSPEGKAPSLGSTPGQTAGLWLDRESSGSTINPLHIRGQGGAGLRVWGGMTVAGANNAGFISSRAGGGLIVRGYADTRFEARSGTVTVTGAADAVLESDNAVARVNGGNGIVLASNGNIALRTLSGGTYTQTWSGGGLRNMEQGGSSGVIYTNTSARRFKTNIKTWQPDDSFLDRDVVTFHDRWIVEAAAEIKRRRAALDATPLTAQESEILLAATRTHVGVIADDAVGTAAEPLVTYAPDGEIEGYNYKLEGVLLRPFVRRHRDEIRRLQEQVQSLTDAIQEMRKAA